MKSSPKRVIRGADVEGIMFCSPKGTLAKEDPSSQKEEDNLKALENFWHSKGLKEGLEQGHEGGSKAGQKEGYQKGFQEGHQQGLDEGNKEGRDESASEAQNSAKEEFRSALELLGDATEKLYEKNEQFLEASKAEITKLIIAICEKILHKKLENTDTFIHIVEKLLSKAKAIAHGEHVQILFFPDDLVALENGLESLDYDKHNITRLDFISDPSVPQGTCRLESSLGLINFDIKRELENLEEELLDQ
ncbi:MAG: flagellar assembly protein FliH [Chlamydiales bacterium]|jgi:flagellar assembly protein FliH